MILDPWESRLWSPNQQNLFPRPPCRPGVTTEQPVPATLPGLTGSQPTRQPANSPLEALLENGPLISSFPKVCPNQKRPGTRPLWCLLVTLSDHTVMAKPHNQSGHDHTVPLCHPQGLSTQHKGRREGPGLGGHSFCMAGHSRGALQTHPPMVVSTLP